MPSTIQNRKTCRMIRILLPPDTNDLGDLGTTPRGLGFAAALSSDDVTADAHPAPRRLFTGLWPGRTDRNRCGRVAQADALLSAAGTAGNPWGPDVREAAARFQVPGHWVRAVMHQELGGEQQATSPVGAMGLMQVMPATYEGLRVRYQLGDDPYDPHNNILAGTAYIREMYDRFGSPGFLAAYNAGPDRVDNYLARRASLPQETVNYVAAITPNLGTDVPRRGLLRSMPRRAPAGHEGRPSPAWRPDAI